MAGESSEAQKKPPLSCTSCRARKLKCDKQDPCRHCARSGTECVFPTRKRIQRPRKTKNTELLQRLSRLESIVGRVGLVIPEETGTGAGADAEAEAETKGTAFVKEVAAQIADADVPAIQSRPHPAVTESAESRPQGRDVVSYSPQNARPPRDSTVSRYMSAEFWSSLCDEVGGLRQALEQTTDSDDEDDNDEGTTPESAGGSGGGSSGVSVSQGMLLGNVQTSGSRVMQHPSPEHIRYLAAVYFRNVDMHLKILHRPTTLNALHDLADHPESASDLSPELAALLFAIYYASITSLSPSECIRVLGQPRADLLTRFQAGIEQALARADYLNNTSLEPLQALTLYVCCLRSHNGSRASWALMGVPIRLAQALNLHQDGEGDSEGGNNNPRFTPFEAEQRRRLWWQLMVLDIRAAEDRGTVTIIARGSYDTRLPHNLDDDEFGPATTTPLRDRTGPSDITFGLFTAQSSGMTLWSSHAPHDADSRDETIRRVRQLEAQFVKGADPTHFGSYISSVIVRIIVLRVWLGMRYPLRPRGGDGLREKLKAAAAEGQRRAASGGAGDASLPHLPGSANTGIAPIPTTSGGAFAFPPVPPEATALARRSTLRTAVSIMEFTDFLETGPHSERTGWWCESYVQWHALAVALVELCAQTQGDIVERAWQVIETVFPRWGEKIADTKRGNLWRPIRKLYKKAKAAREAALSAEGPATYQPRPPILTQQHNSGLGPAAQYMAIDPALTGENTSISTGSLRPRLITDMILSESSAHTFRSGSPIPYANYTKIPPTTMSTDLNNPLTTTTSLTTQSPSLITNLNKPIPSNPNPTLPSDLDPLLANSGHSMAQAWLAWPDLTFDLPALSDNTIPPPPPPPPSSSSLVLPPPLAPPPGATFPTTNTTANITNTIDAQGGDDAMLSDPTFLESNMMMDWSTWDEFVLDTYAADSTPNSGSAGSEGH